MSKINKLIHSPGLFINDALLKRFNQSQRKSGMNGKVNELNKKNNELSVNMLLKYNLDAIKVNLVVVDFIDDCESKSDILKYQCRSIEKYTNFNKIYYISKSIKTTNNNYIIYDTYQDFFDKVVLRISPKKEMFVFIDMNFFFLRNVIISDFISPSGSAITYITKQFKKNERLMEVIGLLLPGANVNFTSINNYCCIDNMQLIHYNDVSKSIDDLDFYLFDFLPTVNSLVGKDNVNATPVQYANLSYGYMDKFVWVKSVHGSKRCPLAITFNHKIKDRSDFNTFLTDIVPHESISEKEVILKS